LTHTEFNIKPIQVAENLAEFYSRRVIKYGFTLVMLIITFIVFISILRLSTVHGTLSEILSHEQVAIEMLFRMQEAARERSVLLYRITSSRDAFERDDLIMQHSKLASQFLRSVDKIRTLKLDETEKSLLKIVLDQGLEGGTLQSKVLDQLALDQVKAANEIINKQAVPLQNKFLASILTLLEYEIEQSHGYEQILKKQQRETPYLLIAGGLVAAIFVVLIAIVVNRRMTKLISGLALTAHQLQNANNSLESLKLAVDHHGIVSIADVQGNITFVNNLFTEISLYSNEELKGQNHRILNSGLHSTSYFQGMWRTILSGEIWQGEICNHNKNGESFWVFSTVVPFLDDTGKPYQYIAVSTDITAIKEAEQVLLRGKIELEKLVDERTTELVEREEVLRSIATAAQDSVIMIDSSGCVTHWNPAAEKMFGYTSGEIIGREILSLVVPDKYHASIKEVFPGFTKTGRGALVGEITEVDALKRDGSLFPIEISISSVNLNGSWHAIAIVRDITIRKLADDNLKKMASTDPLTGVFNRRRFNEVLIAEMARAKRYGTYFILIILDIDHFKHINDSFGHQAGDKVLTSLAALISSNIRNTDIFARWGGEEFTILATHCEDASELNLAEKIRKLIESFTFDEVGKVTCSFGVTTFRNGDDQESIVKRADTNLYQAKETGRNRVVSDLR